jgi:MYXO-CTERM domain-containing protein
MSKSRFSKLVLFVVPVVALGAACSSGDHPALGRTSSALTAPTLGTAATFAVLAGSTVANTGASTINGELGVSPGTAVTGFPPGIQTGGTIHTADAVALQAQNDATTAYDAVAGEACSMDLSGTDLGGLTLKAGVYCFASSAQLTGTLTLDAAGDPSAVFIFKTVSTLTTASNASVSVINGGTDCNVFWKVGSSATVGTNTVFVGSVLALTSISLQTGASVSGRVLARNGAVTMDTNHVALATCLPADAGTDAATSDTGAAPTDSGTESGAVDTGALADSGSPADSAPITDSGTAVTDTGIVADSGMVADSASADETGEEGGSEGEGLEDGTDPAAADGGTPSADTQAGGASCSVTTGSSTNRSSAGFGAAALALAVGLFARRRR